MEDTNYPLWFNIEEFDQFINSDLLDEAVSVQTRMKLARAARRTSKRRSFIRKIRAKRRKNMTQLRQKAFRVVRNQIRKRLHKGNWSKLSYSERARIDGVIDKRKKFIKNVVRQIMPKVVKGESERLRKLNKKTTQYESFIFEEKTKSEVRQGATERKRLQRAREAQVRQLDPAKMAMVVRNEKGQVLIVDKNSFEPENHNIVVPADEMNYEVAKKFSQDPSFKNTLTSERILGTKVGADQEEPKKEGEQKSQTGPASGEAAPAPAPAQPLPDTTKINHKMAEWATVIALNMLKGKDLKQQVKEKLITPEQAKEYEFSQNIQDFAAKVAESLIRNVERLTGRNFDEYEVVQISDEKIQTSDLWKSAGAMDETPKTDIALIHNCVKASKSAGKDCEVANCACEQMGIDQKEQMLRISVKFGRSMFASGRPDGDIKATFIVVESKLHELISGMSTSVLDQEIYLSESDKEALTEVKKEVKDFNDYMVKDFSRDFYTQSGPISLYIRKNSYKQGFIDESIVKLNEAKKTAGEKFRQIFGMNRIAFKIFLHEVLTGQKKFNNSIASADYLLSINSQTFDTKLNYINESFVDELIDSGQIRLDVNFKSDSCGSVAENEAWERTKQQYKDRGERIPKTLDPRKYCGRTVVKALAQASRTTNNESFKFSLVKTLSEQEAPLMDEGETEEIRFEKEYIQNYMNVLGEMSKNLKKPEEQYSLLLSLFNTTMEAIELGPVDLYAAIEDRLSGKVTPIHINGKQYNIHVMNIPAFNSDDESTVDEIKEYANFAKSFISERNYRKEYDNYQGTPAQKKNRAKRNRARKMMMRLGRVRKGDGKDVDHKDGNPKNNSHKNLRVRDKSKNRADNGH
jgi:hypothetical protein